MGATRAVDVSRERLPDVQAELGMKEGFDVGLEMSGNPSALNDMIDNMAHGGRIALLGIMPAAAPVDWNKVVFNMLTIRGIYGREMYDTWYKMTAMIQSGLDISPVITHRLPYTEFQQRLRPHALGQERQDHPQLGLTAARPKPDASDLPGAYPPERFPTSAPRASPSASASSSTPQGAHIAVAGGTRVLNFCANNYLGLADHPEVVAAAHAALDRWGYGLASVRFICGTQEIHKELEARLSAFLRHRRHDPLLLVLRRERRRLRDAARRGGRRHQRRAQPRVDHRRHPALQGEAATATATATSATLRRSSRRRRRPGARFKLVVTDGVFSMDGTIAPLREICDVADRHDALVMVDDSHGGRLHGARTGAARRSTSASMDRVDILTGTLGKALGGASGGYVERTPGDHRPPAPALAALPFLQHAAAGDRRGLDRGARPDRPIAGAAGAPARNTRFFRAGLAGAGLAIKPGIAPDRPRHAGRRRPGAALRRADAGEGRLRDRLLPSRSSPRARRGSARR